MLVIEAVTVCSVSDNPFKNSNKTKKKRRKKQRKNNREKIRKDGHLSTASATFLKLLTVGGFLSDPVLV